MPGTKILNLIALLLLVGAALANYLSPRLDVPSPQALRVQEFPRDIGKWRAGPDRKVDPQIADRLTTATIVERDYRDAAGHDIDVLLVTADRDQDIHDPSLCFPAQGWQMGATHVQHIDQQRVNSVDVQQSGAAYTVLYWLAGYKQPASPASPLLAQLVRLRRRVIGYHEGASLLVRLVAAEGDKPVLEQFAAQAMPEIYALRRSPKTAGYAIADSRG